MIKMARILKMLPTPKSTNRAIRRQQIVAAMLRIQTQQGRPATTRHLASIFGVSQPFITKELNSIKNGEVQKVGQHWLVKSKHEPVFSIPIYDAAPKDTAELDGMTPIRTVQVSGNCFGEAVIEKDDKLWGFLIPPRQSSQQASGIAQHLKETLVPGQVAILTCRAPNEQESILVADPDGSIVHTAVKIIRGRALPVIKVFPSVMMRGISMDFWDGGGQLPGTYLGSICPAPWCHYAAAAFISFGSP